MIRRVAAKEILSTLRDQRAIVSNLLIPLLVLPVMMLGLPLLMGGLFEREQATVTEIGVVGMEHLPSELRAAIEAQNVTLVPVDDVTVAVQDLEMPAALAVPAGFAERLAEGGSADVTIAAKPVHRHEATGLGIMRIDTDGRVVGFVEKPTSEEQLNTVAMDPGWIDAQGIKSQGRECLASMGIYLFSSDVLFEALSQSHGSDFGREILPEAISQRRVQTHLFDGYWEDIGTIRSFYESNLSLTRPDAPFQLASASAPLYSRPRFLPPTRVDRANVERSLIADGCVIHPGAHIENSVIGLRCQIGPNVTIRNSIIMGADYFETSEEYLKSGAQGLPPLGIGKGAIVEGAIVDKNVRIGAGAKLIAPGDLMQADLECECCVRDGVLVVPKEAVIPANWSVV